MRNQLFIGAAIAALVAPAAVQAQETTSTIRGTVTSAGAPVAGAAVEIVHVPSGSRSTVTTDASGSFNAGGLRVGGPFTVKVTAPGYPDFTVTDIFTVIAQTFDVPIELTPDTASTGDDIVVTASSIVNAGTISQGPATVLTSEQISTVASVNRDIRDLMRRDPFARLDYSEGSGRAVSFAGQNARFNRFSVDGVPVTDNFGINPDGLPTRRSPVPFDAIGQFQTKVAPFDVREGNFQGGAINAILKSGTNEFHGTGFYAYSADELTGKKTKPGPGVPTGRVTIPNFKYENYGAQISGPIIPDRLFFMVAGERIRAGTPIAEGTPGDNAGTVIPQISDAALAQVQQIAQSRYGYDTGGVLNNSGDKDDRLVAKIDANLSDTQRASLTYLYTKDSIRFGNNTNVGPAGATGNAPGLGLESNGYVASNRLHTGVFQLNSDWTDEFSTEIRGFYKDYKRGQDPILGRGFAQFQVCTAPTSDPIAGSTDTTNSLNCPSGVISFGPDISRQSNQLSSRTYGGLVQARLTKGDHDLRVFGEYQDTKIFNLFVQRTAGDYYFDSIADFQAGVANRLRYQNAVPSLDPADGAARFKYQSYAFGIQDNWQVSDILSVAYGARYDMYGGSSRPALNQAFTLRNGFTNQAYISGRGVFQPRIGFDFKPVSAVQLRGGVGIFAGGSPDVYVSNSFSNTGFLTNSIDIRRQNNGTGFVGAPTALAAAALSNVNGTTIPAAANTQLLASATVPTDRNSTAPTNELDPNFKLPSQWRATLSADWTPEFDNFLGGGWRFGADFLYSAVRNQVYFTDIRSIPSPSSNPQIARTPDGRVRLIPATNVTATGLPNFADTFQDILLTNTKKGRSYIAVARVEKNFDFGLNLFASYTWQDVKDATPATSSTAGSNYGNGAFFDGNGAAYGTSNDEVRHNIKYAATFKREFFGDYKTIVSLFGETRIGKPYSYTMQDVSNGRSGVFGNTGTSARYLLYVPTSTTDPLVSYDNATTQANLESLITSTGLRKYRGKITPRNAFNSPWFTKLDLHLEQELPVPGWSQGRFNLFMDVENFTNLLNKDWGQIREYSFPYTVAAVRVQCLQTPVATGVAPTTAQTTANTGQACAQYRYTSPSVAPAQQNVISSRQSLYTIRVGARFSF